jgi:hypothetical protein
MSARFIQIRSSQVLGLPRATGGIEDEKISISVPEDPRAGWAEAFKLMAKRGDDVMVIDDLLLDDFEEEWQWWPQEKRCFCHNLLA